MKTEISLVLIRNLVKFSNFQLPVQPIYFIEENNCEELITLKRSKWCSLFWLLIQIISQLLNGLEITYFVLHPNVKNLLGLIFLSLLFMIKVTTFLLFLSCKNRDNEFVLMLNCIYRHKRSFLYTPKISKVLSVFLVVNAVILILVVQVIIPAIVLYKPCFHGAPIYEYLIGNCTTNKFRLIATIISILSVAPTARLCPLLGTISLVSLIKINNSLQGWFFKLKFHSKLGIINRQQTVAFMFRELQIIILLNNLCFQTYVFPAVQFCGGFVVITSLYSLVVLKDQLPNIWVVLLLTFAIVLTGSCSLILDMGGKPMKYTSKIISTLRKHGEDSWSRRFYRSCPQLALKVDPFHKLDEQRTPSFIRFILQRTAFFVMKTNVASHNFNSVISFPVQSF